MNAYSSLARAALICTGALFLLFAAGFTLQSPWATAFWPWPDGRLSYTLLGSLLAAAGVPIIWIGVSSEWGAAEPGAINLAVTFGGGTAWLWQLANQNQQQQLMLFVAAGFVATVLSVVVALWSRRFGIRDPRPTPPLVRASFAVFTVALVVAGTLLLLQTPNVLPWAAKPESGVLFGWFFSGAALYFAYGLLRPRWHYAKGQLLGFLAYDVVLLPIFLPLFASVRPEHLVSLVVYVAVLLYSAAIAFYYLFLNPLTRGAARKEIAA